MDFMECMTSVMTSSQFQRFTVFDFIAVFRNRFYIIRVILESNLESKLTRNLLDLIS